MPIVGIATASVISRPSCPGIASSTIEKQPASLERARVVQQPLARVASLLPCTR